MTDPRDGWTPGEILAALLVDAVFKGVAPPRSWFEEAPGWHDVTASDEWLMEIGPTVPWLVAQLAQSDPCGGNVPGGEGCTCEPPFAVPEPPPGPTCDPQQSRDL